MSVRNRQASSHVKEKREEYYDEKKKVHGLFRELLNILRECKF